MQGLRVGQDTIDRVRAAMRAADRARFLPAEARHLAGIDSPVHIGWDATNSQPSTVARMLELLDAHPGQRVLDVGAGSGWTTAILAELGADVVGVELVPELVELGNTNLAAHASARGRDANAHPARRIRQAVDGVLGLPDDGPWDRILVSADLGRMPEALVAQLAEGGRMVAPVAGAMRVVDIRDGRPRARTDSGTYAFVPLRE
ncbi:protein-L-isoaspartate O-methyltransferase family protein [Agrococcus sp. Ld7]|uniref:protein-L-isoaspartate O-methyltransferase family protein n=1 Tax=Agrococcus sp. Ld7 TaxID=649148 RepID=UPI00386CF478